MGENTDNFSFLEPNTIAVVGASNDPQKRGYQAIERLKQDGFPLSKIYPINPKNSEICGLKAYASVLDVGEAIDLALVCTPAKTVPQVVEDCGKVGIPCCVVVSAGFAEEGDIGKAIENAMLENAKKSNVRIIGPNTNGMFNTHKNVNLLGLDNVPKGKVGIISQSGNILLSLVNEAVINGNVGFSTFIGVGNQSDLNISDYVEALCEDEYTACIFIYAEGFKDGKKFLSTVKKAVSKKPVMLYKSGRTQQGQIAASSHTGALAADYKMTHDVLRQAGVTVLDKTANMACIADALIKCPKANGRRVAVLTDGGGHGTITVDSLVREGMELAELSDQTVKKLQAILPPTANTMNPVDVCGQTDRDATPSAQCVEILLQDPNIDIVLITGMWGGFHIRFSSDMLESEIKAANAIIDCAQKYNKPVLMQSLYTPEQAQPLMILREGGIPIYMHVETCVFAAKAVANYSADCKKLAKEKEYNTLNKVPKVQSLIDTVYQEKRTALLEHEGRDFLRHHNISMTNEFVIENESQINSLPEEITKQTVAVKLLSEDILHKSEAKGVFLNVKGKDEIREAYKHILQNAKSYNHDARILGVMVVPMLESGVEVILGAYRDESFGPVVMFGLGGVFVEVFEDVAFRSVPVSPIEAKAMINQIHASALLHGARNTKPIDEDALTELIFSISAIMQTYPEIKEIDLNPVIVRDDGLDIADVRIILG